MEQLCILCLLKDNRDWCMCKLVLPDDCLPLQAFSESCARDRIRQSFSLWAFHRKSPFSVKVVVPCTKFSALHADVCHSTEQSCPMVPKRTFWTVSRAIVYADCKLWKCERKVQDKGLFKIVSHLICNGLLAVSTLHLDLLWKHPQCWTGLWKFERSVQLLK